MTAVSRLDFSNQPRPVFLNEEDSEIEKLQLQQARAKKSTVMRILLMAPS
jgi:hypothetical protein